MGAAHVDTPGERVVIAALVQMFIREFLKSLKGWRLYVILLMAAVRNHGWRLYVIRCGRGDVAELCIAAGRCTSPRTTMAPAYCKSPAHGARSQPAPQETQYYDQLFAFVDKDNVSAHKPCPP